MRKRLAKLCLAGMLALGLLHGNINVWAVDEAPPAGEDNMAGMPETPKGSGEHPLVWFDISAPDLAASKEFYSSVFGWEMHPVSDDKCLFSTPAGPPGELNTSPVEGQQSTPYIFAKDIDSAISAVEAAGCVISQPKTAVGEWGHTALFVDSAGTTWGISNMAAELPVPHIPTVFGDGPKPPAGALCSVEMYGGDLDKTRDLFGNVFGWGTLGTMPQYMAFDPGAGIAGVFQGHTAVAKSMPYIWVDDVNAAYEKLEAAGGKRMCEAGAMPGMGTFGYFFDPSGTGMGLIGP